MVFIHEKLYDYNCIKGNSVKSTISQTKLSLNFYYLGPSSNPAFWNHPQIMVMKAACPIP